MYTLVGSDVMKQRNWLINVDWKRGFLWFRQILSLKIQGLSICQKQGAVVKSESPPPLPPGQLGFRRKNVITMPFQISLYEYVVQLELLSVSEVLT